MQIDWATLAAIAVVAAGAAVTVVLLVSFAILGLSAPSGRRVHDPGDGGVRSAQPAAPGMALAVVCLLAAALIVCFGLYLILA